MVEHDLSLLQRARGAIREAIHAPGSVAPYESTVTPGERATPPPAVGPTPGEPLPGGAPDGGGSIPGSGPAPGELLPGLFVSLHVGGRLRGCVGLIQRGLDLERAVRHCAVAAATQDVRFTPLSAEELDSCRIEISIFRESPREAAFDEIVIGRHGVIVSQGDRRGVLLPQVAVEEGWNVAALLSAASRKAGLPADAWRTGARIEVFETDVLAEQA